MRTVQSFETRRRKNRERLARWRDKKEAKRIDRHREEPIRGEWRGRFAFTITFRDRISDEFHALDFYLSQKRVNSFRVHRDGQLWRKQISLTDALAGLRKALPKFSLQDYGA